MLYRYLVYRSEAPRWQPVRILARAAFLTIGLLWLAGAPAATFNVNSAADVPDVTPGDGKCETVVDSQVVCTLRAAVQEANALPGKDVINLQANTTYLLTRVGIEYASLSGSLDITDSLDIIGAGPDSTVIDGNGEVTNDRVFFVLSCIGGDEFCAFGKVVVNMTGISIRHGKTTGAGGGIDAPYVDFGPVIALTNCRVEGNASGTDGGGINSGGSLTLTSSVVSGNTAQYGGGANVTGRYLITDSTVSDNEASGIAGGLLLGGSGRLSGSTISGNHGAMGGGIYFVTSPPPNQPRVVNSTISANRSDANGGGLTLASGVADLFNVTIAGNTSNADHSGSDGAGGGVSVAAGATLNFSNSIIANNASFTDTLFSILTDCAGTIDSQGYNIVTHPTCTVVGTFSTNAVQFGLLQYNGGPTRTLALLTGSAGIDAGNPAGCADDLGALDIDQRGLPRPVGPACDLGAYEVQPDPIFKDGFDV